MKECLPPQELSEALEARQELPGWFLFTDYLQGDRKGPQRTVHEAKLRIRVEEHRWHWLDPRPARKDPVKVTCPACSFGGSAGQEFVLRMFGIVESPQFRSKLLYHVGICSSAVCGGRSAIWTSHELRWIEDVANDMSRLVARLDEGFEQGPPKSRSKGQVGLYERVPFLANGPDE